MSKILRCPYCPHVFDRNFNRKRHINSKHNEKAKREPIEEKAPSTSGSHSKQQSANLFKNERIVNGQKKLLCPDSNCGLLFDRRFNLKRHYVAIHASNKPLKRSVASKNSDNNKSSEHEKSFPCFVCNDTFSRKFNLQRHIRTVHPNDHINNKKSEKIYCQLCQTFSCLNLTDLSKHLNGTHQIPMVEVEQQIHSTNNFNRLIEGLRQCFSISFKQSKSNYFVLKCNYTTNFLNAKNEKCKTPCTFHLNVTKDGSNHDISGCYSHFGHEVTDQLSIDQYIDNVDKVDEEFKLFDSVVNDYLTDSASNNDSFDNGNEFLLNQTEKLIKIEQTDNSNRYSNPETFDAGQISNGQLLLAGLIGGSSSQMSSKINEKYLHKLAILEKRAPNEYRANFLRSPTGKPGNAYGGLLFAQSLQAALSTVDSSKFYPHAMHSFFILNVDSTGIVDYKIQNIRDGRSFTTRSVTAEQNSKIVMSSQVSFCVKEETSIEHQAKMPIVPGPESLANSVEFCKDQLEKYEKGEIELPPISLTYCKHTVESYPENIFEIRVVDPQKYYCIEEAESVESYYFWIKAKCPLSDDPQEHLFLSAYLTDMTLAGAANRPHSSRGYKPSMVLSLDHSVRFHDYEYNVGNWMLYENFSPIARNARGFSEGRLWAQDGRLILSTSQESLSRTRGNKSNL